MILPYYVRQKTEKGSSRGLTLIELMISIAIITVVMSISIFKYSTFNDGLALSGAGQEVSLGVRKAQVYGVAVKEVSVGSSQFGNAYGIHFDPNNDPNNYYVFVDKDNDQQYDVLSGCGSGTTECIEKNSFKNGITISAIDSTSGCAAVNSARTLDITFLRPNPDASINFFNNAGNLVNACSPSSSGKVTLTSPKGRTLIVTVLNTGQISIQ